MNAADELTDLLTDFGGGDRERSKAIVADIAAGKLRLPPCFNLRNGNPEQTARVHELARIVTTN